MADDRDEALCRTLVSLEEQGWQALTQGAGADFYQEELTDHALMVFPIGVLTREQSIAAMRAAPPWASFRIENPRVVKLTDDSAILTYRCTAQRAGQEPYSAFMTTAFVRRNGPWKPAFHQHTPASA